MCLLVVEISDGLKSFLGRLKMQSAQQYFRIEKPNFRRPQAVLRPSENVNRAAVFPN